MEAKQNLVSIITIKMSEDESKELKEELRHVTRNTRLQQLFDVLK